MIIPADLHIFKRGRSTTNQLILIEASCNCHGLQLWEALGAHLPDNAWSYFRMDPILVDTYGDSWILKETYNITRHITVMATNSHEWDYNDIQPQL